MSLFGALLGDFDDDGYMGNHMNSMNMQMRNMNRLMNTMMMPDPFNMLTPFDNGFNGGNSLMERVPMLGGGLFGFPAMPNMNRLLSADIGNNGASFCSSSVISMSSGPDGRPQIYQATSSTKTGPGGILETRKTVQDSSSGVKKMAIGHHIGERGHIIEKEQNLHSGQHEERQEFINLDEEEADNFDREFTNKARMHTPAVEMIAPGHHSPHHRQYHRALPALPAPPPTNPSSPKSSTTITTSSRASSSSSSSSSSKKKTPGTITTETTASSAPSTTPTIIPSSSAARRALRNASMATPRKPLRTPTSSPLALTTSGHNSASTTTSVHPHPYNNAAARRNFRSKHPKHKHHSQQQQSERQPQQQQHQESLNNDSN